MLEIVGLNTHYGASHILQGVDLALGADIRVMAQSAKLAASYAKRGVLPESGGTWYLPRMLGWARASELIFTGRTLTADQSLEIGLVNKVVPDAEVMGVARTLALEIAANAPLAIQAAKRTSDTIPLCHPLPLDHLVALVHPRVRVKRVRLPRLEGVEADHQPRRLEERGLAHLVGAPLGMVGRLNHGWMFHERLHLTTNLSIA